MAQKDSSDENIIKHKIKTFFYKIISNLSKEKLLINTTGAGLYDKEIINILKKIDDPYPYFRGLISEITSSVNLIKFHQPKRERGVTKNNFYTLYDIGILGVVKHSKVPLRIMTFTGFVLSFVSIIIGLFSLASFQIFLLGFIGEYVMTILDHTRKLPLVIEKERINFD